MTELAQARKPLVILIALGIAAIPSPWPAE
jgi:hypothetical protein